MAPAREFPACSQQALNSSPKKYWKTLIIASAVALAISFIPTARAQLQQPLVFSSAGAVASRNDQTGALTPVAGSPFISVGQSLVIDVQGRYLFAVGTNSVRMFAITDSTTGAYQEVAGSPFASTVTNQPAFIAVEPTGQYVAVVNQVGQKPGDGLVETFQIAPTVPGGPALVPVFGSATELDSMAIGFAQPPNDKGFLIFMGPNPQSATMAINQGSEFQSLSIDPSSGFITGYQQSAALPQRGLSFAMDPQGRYYVTGSQDNLLEFGILQLTGIGGDALNGNIQLPIHNYPDGLWIDSTGTFLYVATSDLDQPIVVNIYAVNLQTGQLTATASSPLPNFTAVPPYYADPTGAFDFGFGTDANTAIAYSVDPQTGYFVETGNSPFTVPQINGSLTFSIPPGQQGVSGPSALLSTTNLSFGPIQTGSVSAQQSVTLTSNGGEALSVNSISLSGADPTQFQETDTCQVPAVLQPAKFCSISITFAPSASATGSQQATLTITDNAPGNPQTVTLGGEGVAPPPPAPAVTVIPNPVSFPTTTQGVTSSPMTIGVTNSGNATLNISSVILGGNNSSEFSMTNGCSGSYVANAGCMITMTFTPLAAGQRSATITITDDAPNSPQIIPVSGTATTAAPTKPIVSLSSANLVFGTITQGAASAQQSVSVSNPGGAPLHISSVSLGGTSPSDFSLTNGCTASSYAVNASCTLSVSFGPLLTGSRAASVILVDDAADSPQTIQLSGTANPAVVVGAAPGGSTSATVSAGQAAVYNLQITPGAGFTGAVSLTYSGAPIGAAIQGPTTLQITNGNATPFTVSIATSGGTSTATPFFKTPRVTPLSQLRAAPVCVMVALLLAFAAHSKHHWNARRGRVRFAGAFGAAILFAIFGLTWTAAGCGGGSANVISSQPQVVTPQGQFTITIAPSATSANGKPLQLPPIQLTLVVN
jgi:hypothetical protein